jgi:hypothetical protein
MRRVPFTRDDVKPALQIAAIFVAFGAVVGLLRDGDPFVGAFAGLLLFSFMAAVGWLVSWVDRRFDRPWS